MGIQWLAESAKDVEDWRYPNESEKLSDEIADALLCAAAGKEPV